MLLGGKCYRIGTFVGIEFNHSCRGRKLQFFHHLYAPLQFFAAHFWPALHGHLRRYRELYDKLRRGFTSLNIRSRLPLSEGAADTPAMLSPVAQQRTVVKTRNVGLREAVADYNHTPVARLDHSAQLAPFLKAE